MHGKRIRLSGRKIQIILMMFQKGIIAALTLVSASMVGPARAEDNKASLNFQEIFGLISSNLSGLTPADIEKAAATGLISQLGGRVELVVENSGATTSSSLLLSRTNIYEGAYGYFRVGRVA